MSPFVVLALHDQVPGSWWFQICYQLVISMLMTVYEVKITSTLWCLSCLQLMMPKLLRACYVSKSMSAYDVEVDCSLWFGLCFLNSEQRQSRCSPFPSHSSHVASSLQRADVSARINRKCETNQIIRASDSIGTSNLQYGGTHGLPMWIPKVGTQGYIG